MTTSPNPDDPDTGGSTVPPYDGRRETADLEDQEKTSKEGANVGGATGPTDDDEAKAADPAETERGATGSPADEQPAAESTATDTDPDVTGPSHTEGTGRAEDQP